LLAATRTVDCRSLTDRRAPAILALEGTRTEQAAPNQEQLQDDAYADDSQLSVRYRTQTLHSQSCRFWPLDPGAAHVRGTLVRR
jgi:hypothetical protein